MKNLAKNHSPAILGPLDDWNSLQDWKGLGALEESVISTLDCCNLKRIDLNIDFKKLKKGNLADIAFVLSKR